MRCFALSPDVTTTFVRIIYSRWNFEGFPRSSHISWMKQEINWIANFCHTQFGLSVIFDARKETKLLKFVLYFTQFKCCCKYKQKKTCLLEIGFIWPCIEWTRENRAVKRNIIIKLNIKMYERFSHGTMEIVSCKMRFFRCRFYKKTVYLK